MQTLDKIYVVFGCRARYKGTFINDHFSSRPYLMNPSLGMLHRLRLEIVAFLADMPAIFYQVRTCEDDRPSLQFLGWGDDDLNSLFLPCFLGFEEIIVLINRFVSLNFNC